VSHRPLVFLSGLTLGDYLLWNWSLNNNHDALALASGVTLPPLVVASVWLLALSVMRVIARSRRLRGMHATARASAPAMPSGEAAASADAVAAAAAERASGKIAA
jgi:hypothetical protein